MNLPPVQPRTRYAHEAAHWARTVDYFDEYNAAIFRAFFERGEDIGKVGVLVRLASDLGLDYEGLRAALERRDCEKSVLSDEQDALSYRIKGVPAFVVGRQSILTGVQPLERLKEIVAWARANDRS